MSGRTVQLGEVATIERRAATEAECANLPFVGLEHVESGSGNFAGEFKRRPEPLLATKFRFGAEHVLYGKLRPYLNKVVLPDFDGVCTTEILPILPKSGSIDRRFLYALLLSPYFVRWASLRVSGANLPRLDPGILEEFCFDLPSLPEQERIARLLAQAGRLRRTRRYALELSDNFLPAAFLDLFGRANPESANWSRVGLTELCEHEDDIRCGPFGTQLSKGEFRRSGVPLWGIKHVNAGFELETDEFLTQAKSEALDAYSLLPGDLVMTRKGTIGNCAIYPLHFQRGIMHSDLLRIRLRPGAVSPLFLNHQLHFDAAIKRQINLISGGAIMAGINVGMLKSIRIQLPPMKLQQHFSRLVAKYDRLQARQREALRQAEHLFQSLLHCTFTAGA